MSDACAQVLAAVAGTPQPLVVIAGPTASGKSALAAEVASALGNTLIIGADSRQVYRGVRIASAGPSDDDLRQHAHALYASLDPVTDAATAGWFRHLCDEAVAGHDGPVVIVGGAGLYLRAWRLGVDAAPADLHLREQLNQRLQQEGLQVLVTELHRLDAPTAARTDLRNPMRVVRALERVMSGDDDNHNIEELLIRAPQPTAARACWFYLDANELDQRIQQRTAAMFEQDIIGESVALAKQLPMSHPLLSMIGTAEALSVSRGERSVEEATSLVFTRTRQYAKRQRTWFRKEPWWQHRP
jgi:tRNA dimethylallyltransferase